MINTAIRHSVTDYGKWKSVYDTFLPTTAGAKYARVNRSVEDPNTVTVVAGFDTLEFGEVIREQPDPQGQDDRSRRRWLPEDRNQRRSRVDLGRMPGSSRGPGNADRGLTRHLKD